MPLSLITEKDRPLEIAAIDLGSNSFHMVIARIVNGALQVLSRLKQRVYLAEGLNDQNELSEEAMERGLACLALFAERLQGFPAAQVTIVGTHSLREAVNAHEFLERAASVIPYPIEIISGHEEARLIFMGVEHTQPEKGRKLVIDIGGGSTELVIGERFEPILIESRRMGCVSFSRQFFPDGKITEANFNRARLMAVSIRYPGSPRCKRWVLGAGMYVSVHPAPSKRPVRSCVNWGSGTALSPLSAWKCWSNRCYVINGLMP